MEFILLFLLILFLGIAWSILFNIMAMYVLRNIGLALLPLATGLSAVGYITGGFEDAHLGPILLLALALGMASLMLPMLVIDKYFKKGAYCARFRHKRGKYCRCVRCGQAVEHVRGNDCKCSACGKSLPHMWLPGKEGKCSVECSVCGYKRPKDSHSWSVSGEFKHCTICNMYIKIKMDIQIVKKDSPCDKNESGHHTEGCYCKYCEAIIIEAAHEWERLNYSSHDGSGETVYKCSECDLKRSEWFNPYTEGTSHRHDRKPNWIG